ncbi:MAG: hypothetical protein A3F90_01175 [Deltaproteobacteria bacterium RIFCSPLOWO2_12_FULL_60_19]|nr:MAG: hypothetical protein A3F90_01175 [Deltaproteobacteria bacterium RIFCSPLOWO2_12_FULL_60_19]
MRINSAKDLEVYKKAYDSAMKIFRLSKNFPDEEYGTADLSRSNYTTNWFLYLKRWGRCLEV